MSTLTTKKQELIDWIDQLEDQAMLENVDMLKKASEGSDWWNEISEAEKESIKQGREDIKEGRTISKKEFLKKHAHRL